MIPILTACLTSLPALLPPVPDGNPEPVRYVRIELPGEKRVLSLTEVQVLRGGRNLAPGNQVSQSSVDHGGEAKRAIDANVDAFYDVGSTTHTREEKDPWWELDLGREQLIDQVTIFNRQDCCSERLNGFRLVLLDENRDRVWSVDDQPARWRVDYTPFGASLIGPKVSVPREQRDKLQPLINEAIDRGAAWLIDGQLRDGAWPGHENFGCGQTALVAYTLLKCGVPRSHPAVRRGVEYVRQNPATKTYSAGCALMLYEAAGGEENRAAMVPLLEEVLDWQGATGALGLQRGAWGYPESIADLSNTQYAALGLRAAIKAGLEVPRRTFERMIEDTLKHQEKPHNIEVVVEKGRSSSGTGMVAGFNYRAGAGGDHGKATGSMTTAGIGVLAICDEALGDKLTGSKRKELETSLRNGLAWLAHHFSVDHNPQFQHHWLDYYLYGLERVGSLLGIDQIGDRDWYWEGAKHLVNRQEDGGEWGSVDQTCFALLFLARATASSTGPDLEAREDVYAAEAAASDVQWRSAGDEHMTFWITGFGDGVLGRFTDANGAVAGLRVARVEYVIDGEVVHTVQGDTQAAWEGERYAYKHRFPGLGKYKAEAHVHVVDPRSSQETVIKGGALDIAVRRAVPKGVLEYASQGAHNLLRGARVRTVQASSHNAGHQTPDKAVDGHHNTRWICKPGEKTPELVIELERPVRANRILLSPLAAHSREWGSFDRATRIEVLFNRSKDALVIEPPQEDYLKAVVNLEKPVNVRRITLRILERTEGSAWKGQVGFSEVELIYEK